MDGRIRARASQKLAERRRRWDGRFKLARQPDLRALVRTRLAMGWSPEQIAGRLTLEHGHTVISHEFNLSFHLPPLCPEGLLAPPAAAPQDPGDGSAGAAATRQPHPASPADRRATAGRRRSDQAGTLGSRLHAVRPLRPMPLSLHERQSRCSLVTILPIARPSAPPAASPAAQASRQARRKTLTFDNGTEFAQHHRLTDQRRRRDLLLRHPQPWQKGGIENAIGRLRRTCRAKPTSDLYHRQLHAIVQHLQQHPAKMPRLQNPSRGILTPQINRCTSNVSPRLRGDDPSFWGV